MRLHRRVPMIAAVIAVVGTPAPASHGFELAGGPTGSLRKTTIADGRASG